MLKFNSNGIYCEQGDFYIDPWRPVDRAVITHAHSDHARWGSKYYLAHKYAVPILRIRLGQDINVQALEYHEEIMINGVRVTLHPAGHIIGSAQVRIEYQGEVWVVSGDYKLQHDGISEPFEPVRCHHFITESTFGLPVYHFPSSLSVADDINSWCRRNHAEGKSSIIIGYALGKAQRILTHLDPDIAPVYVHGAINNVNIALKECGIEFPFVRPFDPALTKKELHGCIVVAPPSAVGSPWLRRFDPYSVGICSGWMQLRGARRRQSVDRGFVLSDHADWDQLNEAVKATGAENIYVTHGFKSIYAKWLREEYGLNATEVETLYEGEKLEDEKGDTIAES